MKTAVRLYLPVAACLLGSSAFAQFTVTTTSYPVGPQPDAAAIGNLDADSDLDLAVANDAPDKVSLLFNNGAGVFGAPVHVQVGNGTGPHTPVIGDLDGDGDRDIAVSLHNANQVQLIVNTGSGFSPSTTFPVGADPRDLEIGDLDNDGDLDLVVSNLAGNTVSVLRNNGNLQFTVTSFAAGLEPREIDLGDVTGDGLLDIAIASHDSDAVTVLRNAGAASFVPHATLPTAGNSPEGVVIARLDGDADFDIAATHDNNNVQFAIVFLNNGGGTFGGGTSFPTNGLDSGSLTAGDIDADGDQDLATANTDSNNASLLANSGAGTFAGTQLVPVGTSPGHITAGNLDGTGGTDLVTTNEASGNVTVILSSTGGRPPMTSMCHPGIAGVIACPCGNPPAAVGRGCNNSAGTGGAVLSASGTASLSNDTLTFTATGELATATSLLLQGDAQIASGAVFGQGVRCAGGQLERLFLKIASGGTITAPGAGDPPVSVRSAQRGDTILAGQDRFYLVYYRDPAVLGGCSPVSTFNATQGGRVTWAP